MQSSPRSLSISQTFTEALQFHQSGRLSEAERRYRLILTILPDHAPSRHLLGVVAHQVGKYALAVALIGQAIRVNGMISAFHCNLAAALGALGYADLAIQSGRRAVELAPDQAEAHANLGNSLLQSGDRAEAIAHCRIAITLKPDHVAAYCNLANGLNHAGHHREALTACRLALQFQPDCAQAHSNRGNSLQLAGNLDEALAAYGRAMVCQPDFAEVLSNRGAARKEAGLLDLAEQDYRRALYLDPAYPEAHLNLANLLLLTGRYEQGFAEFEWRWQNPQFLPYRRDFAKAQWRGEDLAGKRILLHAEQGFGDTIQFCRYVPLVAARGGRVLLELPAAQAGLLRQIPGIEQIVTRGAPWPDFDLHCPLPSLPLAFGTKTETVPAAIPYLQVDPDRVAAWRRHVGDDGFRIGIAWQGSPSYGSDRTRSAPLASFAPLAKIPNVRLISLQKGHGLDQLQHLPDGMNVETLGEDFDAGPDAFLDSAAVMMSLDLVITVDTAIGHLAGALGRPVWLALSMLCHWPWLIGRDDTLWYPATRLFRQVRPGDWDELFGRMAQQLASVLRNQSPMVWPIAVSQGKKIS